MPRRSLILLAASLAGCSVSLTITLPWKSAYPDENILIPAIGTATRKQLIRPDGSLGEVSVVSVIEHRDGRPIFKAKILGNDALIAETAQGTAVWSTDCPEPSEAKTLPLTPNQCDWSVCYPPKVGEEHVRPMTFYASLLACAAKPAELRMRTVSMTTMEGYGETFVVDSTIHVPGMTTVRRKSHIVPGIGEVYSETSNGVMRYLPSDRKMVHWNNGSR